LYCLPGIAFTSASAIPAYIGDFRTLEMEISLLHVADLVLSITFIEYFCYWQHNETGIKAHQKDAFLGCKYRIKTQKFKVEDFLRIQAKEGSKKPQLHSKEKFFTY
jgi:hypothetical protein